jgi:hypothetical protein
MAEDVVLDWQLVEDKDNEIKIEDDKNESN